MLPKCSENVLKRSKKRTKRSLKTHQKVPKYDLKNGLIPQCAMYELFSKLFSAWVVLRSKSLGRPRIADRILKSCCPLFPSPCGEPNHISNQVSILQFWARKFKVTTGTFLSRLGDWAYYHGPEGGIKKGHYIQFQDIEWVLGVTMAVHI